MIKEYETLRKRFALFNKSITEFRDKKKGYLMLFLFCMICILKWNLWYCYSPILPFVIVGCYLPIGICYFIPLLKKYDPLLNIVSFSIYFPSLFTFNQFKGKEYLYVIMATGLIVSIMIQIGKLDIISPRLRKWLFLLFILFSVGFLVYVFDKTTPITFKIASLIVLMISSIWFAYMNRIETDENKKEIEQLRQAQTQAKLSFLKDQLSPHFLFNTLNTLTSISNEQPVKEYIEEVGNIYRYILQYKEEDSVPLGLEIKVILNLV